jgi:hypothetical protein
VVFDQVTVDSAASALRARLFGSGCCFRIGGPCVGQVGAGEGRGEEDGRRVCGIEGVHKGQRSVSSGTHGIGGRSFAYALASRFAQRSISPIELRGITPL